MTEDQIFEIRTTVLDESADGLGAEDTLKLDRALMILLSEWELTVLSCTIDELPKRKKRIGSWTMVKNRKKVKEVPKEEESNPAYYCSECYKNLGFRGFCSQTCHDRYYANLPMPEETADLPLKDAIE